MIHKNKDEISTSDIRELAGQKAEQQMAFYLQRAFGSDNHVHVLNDIRVYSMDDVAQIDHLIIYRDGMIIIESKSVTTKVKINQNEEWMRLFDASWRGMPSPIQQAKRQADFLRSCLNNSASSILGKILGKQKSFKYYKIDVLIAVSDTGIIERPANLQLPEVLKADQIVDRIKEIIKERRKKNSVFSLTFKDQGVDISEEEVQNLINFLINNHEHRKNSQKEISKVPEIKKEAAPSSVKEPESEQSLPEINRCRHCGSVDITFSYGRYGYYFKCGKCSGNTSISIMCDKCHHKTRIRKSKMEIYSDCEQCKESKLIFAISK